MAVNDLTALRQHINFYGELDRKQELPFSARQLLVAMAVLTLVLCLPYGWVYFSQVKSANTLKSLQQQHGPIKKRLDAVTKSRDELLKDTKYTKLIENAERELNFKQRVMTKVSRPQDNSFNGFAQYLLGLARQHVQGLWLTEINLQQSGETMSMQGRALQPELVPRYIQGLRAETVFMGKQFREFSVEQVSGEEPIVAFSVSGMALQESTEN